MMKTIRKCRLCHLPASIFILTLILGCSVNTLAETVKVGDLQYEISGKNASVVAPEEGSTYSGDIVIPETIQVNDASYTVNRIKTGAFDVSTSSNVTSIVIPASVTAFETKSFKELTHLTYVEFSDADKTLKISSYSNGGAFYKCTIDNIYLGRTTSGRIFDICILNKINRGGYNFSFTTGFIYNCKLSEEANKRFVVPEGILRLDGESLNFAQKVVKHLVLPSTLCSVGGNIGDQITRQIGEDNILECKAKATLFGDTRDAVADYFIYPGTPKYGKLIVPKGCKDYYINCNWGNVAAVIEEAEDDEPGTGGETVEPTEPEEKVYVTIAAPAETGSKINPVMGVTKGGDFVTYLETAEGWKLSSATFQYTDDTQTPAEESPLRIEEDSETPEVLLESTGVKNRYKLTANGIERDGRIAIVLEAEVPTEIVEKTPDKADIKVRVIQDDLLITSSVAGEVQTYDIAGILINHGKINPGDTYSVNLPSRNIYIVKIGDKTYKIAN